MKYSVVIPVLNEENYIGVLLDSLKNQTFKDFEVIVIDGKSEDKTKEVVSEFKESFKNFRLIESPKRGVSFQRNFGAKKAKTDNLMFMDADIYLEDDFLYKIDKYLKSKSADVLTVKNIPMSSRLFDKFIYWFFCDIYLPVFSRFSPAAIGTFIYITREAFESVEGFPGEIFIGEDFDLVRRVYKKGFKKFVILKDPPVYFSVRRLNETGRLRFLINNIKGTYYYYLRGGIKHEHSHKFDYEFGKHE